MGSKMDTRKILKYFQKNYSKKVILFFSIFIFLNMSINIADATFVLDETLTFGGYINIIDIVVSVNDASGVEETTATLSGYLDADVGEACTCGFWYGNIPTSQANVNAGLVTNVTCPGTYNEGNTFTKAVSGLISGEYYYVRAWAKNSLMFNTSVDESHFITKPYKPTNLQATDANVSSISLSWTNDNVPVGTNRSTVILYKTGNYPSSITDGTIGYNNTASSGTISALSPGTTYYFSAFTYVNNSGSPSLFQFSDLYDYTSSITGGSYTIHVRYEGNGSYVDLSLANTTHSFLAERQDGTILYSNSPDNATGMFSFVSTESAQVATFNYNGTCERSVLVSPGETDITFYISTSPQGIYTGNLISVTIKFEDPGSLLTIDKKPYGFIYKYNDTGRQYIHSSYLQADLTLRTWLIVGESYHIGVGSNSFVIDNLRELSIYDTTSFTITVQYTAGGNNTGFAWMQYFTIDRDYNDGNIQLFFNDDTHNGFNGVQDTIISLYYNSNGTLIESVDASDIGFPWNFSYSYSGVNGTYYQINLAISYYYEYNSYIEQWNKTIILPFSPYLWPIIVPDLDDKINDTIGKTPIYYIDSDGVEYIVSWAVTIALCIAMIPLLMFGKELAAFGIIGCGLVMFFFNAVIQMITFQNVTLATVIIFIGILTHIASKKGERT